MKKFFAILMTLALMLSLAVPAFAVDSSITVNHAKPGETYNAYQMFKLKVNNDTDPTAYSYTINDGWTAFFTDTGAGATYITVNDAGYVTAVSDAAALAKAAAAWTGKPGAAASVTVADGADTAVLAVQENGYWLITSTLGTLAMIETTPDKNDVEVNEKNPEDTITKVVQEDSDSSWGDQNDAQVGDTVYFRSSVTLVKGTRNVVVHDKMDSGLTYTPSSVAIEGLTKGTEYTVNETPTDGDTFDITFTQSWIDGLDFGEAGYKEYVITYTAVLNENAVVKSDDGVAIVDQNNKTRVSFGDGSKSEEDTTTTTTHKFSVYKHATGKTENLAGAVFSLKKNGTVVKLIKLDDNNYCVANGAEEGAVETFTTVATGDIVIWGVDADDDYTLAEITPPEGYNKLNAEVEVEVSADNALCVDVENKAGAELPSTGGMGTTIFYAVGGVMVAAAAVLLITKKRMSAEG